MTLVASTSTYTLTTTNIKKPVRAMVIDSSGNERWPVWWINYDEFRAMMSRRTNTGTLPRFYTSENLHNTGQIIYHPRLGATFQHPTIRHYIFTRIGLATGNSNRLNVPSEVDEAIFRWALADLMGLVKGRRLARDELAVADTMRTEVLHEHEGHGEIALLGVRYGG